MRNVYIKYELVYLCVIQTPRCPDARISSLPHLRVPVHGPEEILGLHPLWPVHGRYVGQGKYYINSVVQ